jgi:hypothetical protein
MLLTRRKNCTEPVGLGVLAPGMMAPLEVAMVIAVRMVLAGLVVP